MADKQQTPGSRPGVMGDWSEEQNLGQKGDPKARIGEAEVKAAFGKPAKGAAPGKKGKTH